MKPKDLVTLERGRLKLFRYPTWGIGIYLGRGVTVLLFGLFKRATTLEKKIHLCWECEFVICCISCGPNPRIYQMEPNTKLNLVIQDY